MNDRLPLEMYPCRREISLVFADVDTLGHVNNVAIARFFEEGRVVLNRAIAALVPDGEPLRTVLAHVEIDYLAEVRYPGAVQLGIGVGRIGRTSIGHEAGLFQNGSPVAVSRSVDVNTVEGRPGAVALSEAFRIAANKLLLPDR
ncbi:acyl-CoA thioesterase [Nocardia nova]|uniref:Acyl-CoA thioesterase n=1 Tax=Nocardia nova TaxID=37330 RepID=A0A2S6AN64_9NOCA|nr:acyl-CoA thioesterase [Nocardia nova]PPJ25723.1 acyl-CoA thioesterase [Nocardia nova]PPJ36649.1 acyl-CoA thioesterase [Nocardia nova]